MWYHDGIIKNNDNFFSIVDVLKFIKVKKWFRKNNNINYEMSRVIVQRICKNSGCQVNLIVDNVERPDILSAIKNNDVGKMDNLDTDVIVSISNIAGEYITSLIMYNYFVSRGATPDLQLF